VLGGGALEQLEVRRHACRDGLDVRRARHLQAVRPVVVEALRLEESVELLQDVARGRRHVANIAVWNTDRASGRGAAW
jgi:hypothetical protein